MYSLTCPTYKEWQFSRPKQTNVQCQKNLGKSSADGNHSTNGKMFAVQKCKIWIPILQGLHKGVSTPPQHNPSFSHLCKGTSDISWKNPLGLVKWGVELLTHVFILLILTALSCFWTSNLLCKILYLDCFSTVCALKNTSNIYESDRSIFLPTLLILYVIVKGRGRFNTTLPVQWCRRLNITLFFIFKPRSTSFFPLHLT